MTRQPIPIIAVTGTKGKTSVVQLLASAYLHLGQTVLRVDNDGVSINDKRTITPYDSMKRRGLIPSVRPGDFLNLQYETKQKFSIAILEASIGSARHGLGYETHDIGIFTNIYEDHIGKHLKTRADLANAKSFIVTRVKDGGALIYNADEPLISALAEKEKNRINLIPVGLTHDADWTSDRTSIIYKGQSIVALSSLPWIIDSVNVPYVYNALFVAASLHHRGVPLDTLRTLLPLLSLDASSGRLEVLGSEENIRVLLTFAHEKVSLRYIYQLARRLAKDNKVGALVRTRTSGKDDSLMKDFVAACLPFDELVIYEKTLDYTPDREIKAMGMVLQKSFQTEGRLVPYIAEEDRALEMLISKLTPGSVAVHIINGDARKSRQIAISILTK